MQNKPVVKTKKYIKRPLMYMMCGTPKAGKSTWVNNNVADTCIIISYDKYKETIEDWQWSMMDIGSTHTKATEYLNFMFWEITNQKKDIVLDFNNTRKIQRQKFIKTAKKKGYKVKGIEILTPLDVCIERAQKKSKSVIDGTSKWNEDSEKHKGLIKFYADKESLHMNEGFNEIKRIDGTTGKDIKEN